MHAHDSFSFDLKIISKVSYSEVKMDFKYILETLSNVYERTFSLKTWEFKIQNLLINPKIEVSRTTLIENIF